MKPVCFRQTTFGGHGCNTLIPAWGPKPKNFGGQGTYVLHVGNSYIFMADVWRPEYPSDARYIWLPIEFDKGSPVIRWKTEWAPGNM